MATNSGNRQIYIINGLLILHYNSVFYLISNTYISRKRKVFYCIMSRNIDFTVHWSLFGKIYSKKSIHNISSVNISYGNTSLTHIATRMILIMVLWQKWNKMVFPATNLNHQILPRNQKKYLGGCRRIMYFMLLINKFIMNTKDTQVLIENTQKFFRKIDVSIKQTTCNTILKNIFY